MDYSNWYQGKPLEANGVLDDRLAVLVIDMQDNYLARLPSIEIGNKLIAYQKVVLRECVKHDVPVAYIEFENQGDTSKKIIDDIKKVRRSNRFVKQGNDGFSNPRLEETLKEWETRKLFLMGLFAGRCVMTTAFSALEKGFEIGTSEKVIASQDDFFDDLWQNWYKENGLYFS